MNIPFLRFTVIVFLISVSASCNKNIKTPEETLTNLGIDQTVFNQLSVCEQINVYAEAGYRYLDMDHMAVNLPAWMDKEIKSQNPNSVATCIGNQILEYLSEIHNNADVYYENSLKIHSLIYLAYHLDQLDTPEINTVLDMIVCNEDIVLVDENFTNLFYLTKYDGLPPFTKEPDYTKMLEKEACKE